jgi:hypothetical protein
VKVSWFIPDALKSLTNMLYRYNCNYQLFRKCWRPRLPTDVFLHTFLMDVIKGEGFFNNMISQHIKIQIKIILRSAPWVSHPSKLGHSPVAKSIFFIVSIEKIRTYNEWWNWRVEEEIDFVLLYDTRHIALLARSNWWKKNYYSYPEFRTGDVPNTKHV